MKTIQHFYFPERNRIFLALTTLLLPMIFLMIKYSDAPLLLPEDWFGFLLCDPNDDKTIYNIAISYAAAYIFYIVQVYIPTTSKEKHAWQLIHRLLSSIVREFKELFYIVEHMIEFNDDGVAEIKEISCYYKMEYLDRHPQPMDNHPSHQIKKGKHVRKTPASCENVSDLCKKFAEVGKHAQKFMDLQALANLDPHINTLLIDMNIGKFCEETANTLNVIQKAEALREALSVAHIKAKLPHLQEIIKDIPGFCILNDGNKYWIAGPDNLKIDIPNNSCDHIPLHTSLKMSIESLKADISKLEKYHDLDGQVCFYEMSDDEIKDHREYSHILAQATKKVF